MNAVRTVYSAQLLTPREAEELIGIIRDAGMVCSESEIAGHDRYVAELLSARLARMGFTRRPDPEWEGK